MMTDMADDAPAFTLSTMPLDWMGELVVITSAHSTVAGRLLSAELGSDVIDHPPISPGGYWRYESTPPRWVVTLETRPNGRGFGTFQFEYGADPAVRRADA